MEYCVSAGDFLHYNKALVQQGLSQKFRSIKNIVNLPILNINE